MADSLNKACILGNVGKEPEIRNTQTGSKIANITVATSESWKDKSSGERRERTEWHKIVVFNPFLVGVIENHVKKGTKVYIEGAITTRKWTDQSGQDRYSTEIVIGQYEKTLIIMSAPAAAAPQQERPAQAAPPAQRQQPQSGYSSSVGDDDIPF